MIAKIKMEYVCLLFLWGFISLFVLRAPNDQFPFADTDDYMRLVYVLEYMTGNLGWYDHIISRSNVPFGCDIHWTHLYDLILIAGTYIFKPFYTTLKEALLNWSIIVTPLISCFSIIMFYKICRHFFSKELSVLSGILFVFHPFIYAQIRMYRPDHHALLILFSIIMVKFFIDFIKSVDSVKFHTSAFKLGVAYSLAITASPELLIVVLPLELFFVIHWCIFKRKASIIALKSWYWLLTIILCYVVFSSDGYHAIQNIDYDKISIVHVALAFASAGFWSIISAYNKRKTNVSTKQAILFVIGVGAPIIAAIWLIFPDIIYLMSGKISPELKTLWLSKVSEMRSPLRDMGHSCFWMLLMLFALTVHGILITYKRYMYNLKLEHKFFIIYSFIVIFIYAVIGAITYRVLYYFSIFSIPLVIISLLNIKLSFVSNKYKKHAIIQLFAILMYIIPISLALIAHNKNKNNIDELDVIKFLNTIKTPSVILAPQVLGPKILFYTNHSIITAPYHRQEYGLLAGCKVFTSDKATLGDLQEIIKTSNISYIIIPTDNTSSICKQLLNNQLPSYLERINAKIKNGMIIKVRN